MPALPRTLALLTTSVLAILVCAPVSGASAAGVEAPDGLRRTPDRAATTSTIRRVGHPATARAAQSAASDPRAGDQWALQGDAPMGIDSAWRQTTGADVTVAIIDSGIDLGHPDLVPNLWSNPGEVPGNGVDDDGNGYVDDVHGYDFVDRDGTPQDANGHGTHVAGIAAARGGNGIGVAGVAWRARLMAVRVLDADARGTTTAVAEGIRYAVDNGARIINLSLAGPSSTPDLQDAVRDAQTRGVLIVVAVGNEGADLAAAPTFPAGYAEDNVLGVAATRRDGVLSSVSDYGPGADLAAPGEEILSTALGGGYEWRTGTSMAAPQVAGALVLLAAARPDLDAAGLRAALLSGVRRTGLPVEDGALDAGAALRRVIDPSAWKSAPAAALSSYAAATGPKPAKAPEAKRKAKARKLAAAARRKRAAATQAAKARAHAKARKAAARRRAAARARR
ncbi:MAG TPA: S8 family peptidase [Baekduia sp.]|nr:S8 family peptidase [Baekduia sp.]